MKPVHCHALLVGECSGTASSESNLAASVKIEIAHSSCIDARQTLEYDVCVSQTPGSRIP